MTYKSEEIQNCPACQDTMSPGYGIYRFEMSRDPVDGELGGKNVHYRACSLCGCVGKFPLPPEEELRRYYQEAWQYQSPRPGYDLAARTLIRGMADKDGRGVFPAMADGQVGDGTVLDVGSKGSRMFQALQEEGLTLLRDAGGLDAQPVSQGVQRAWLGSGDVGEANHSIVVAAHVLEHVLRPDVFMMDLSRLLAQDGYAYIEVPSLRGGLRDVGHCDDLNRNHLWHFGLHALMKLGALIGTVTLLETDTSLPGWPVDRMVVKKTEVYREAIRLAGAVAGSIDAEYSKAADEITRYGIESVGLYGASHSYAQLLKIQPSLASYRVYDQHKAGLKYRTDKGKLIPIEDPKDACVLLKRHVYVTTRSYNSYIDIKKWLNLHRPELLVETPYASLAKELKEGAFYEGPL